MQFPVPEPLWVEHDKAALGTRFIVVRGVAGSTDIGPALTDARRARGLAEQLARVMARIHAITPGDIGRTVRDGLTAGQGTGDYLESIYGLYRGAAEHPNPRIEAAFGWMRANAPVDDGRPATLVHGDIGFHNLMTHEGAVTGVLDWECAHFGDPMEDVSYCRPFVEALLPWADFLEIYQSNGGVPYSEERDRYYAVWSNLRNACGCVCLLDAYHRTGPAANLKHLNVGLISGPRFEIAALRSIAAWGDNPKTRKIAQGV
jgi:aminoglycoside phosphotransferase (APT) family kinase protein